MDILRTILIIVGILLIAGIYLAEPLKKRWQAYREGRGQQHDDHLDDLDSDEVLGLKRRQQQDDLPDEWVGEAYITRRDDPSADSLNELKGMGRTESAITDDLSLRTDDDDELPGKPAAQTAPRQPDEVIVLTLMAAQGRPFRGTLLLKSLQDAGLRHGEMSIFHFTPEGHRQSLFSVANILEPGHFDLSEMVQMETPGIALFMQLPASLEGEVAWQLMRERAEQMAASLHGSLCDAQRRPLDEEGLLLLQHQAAAFRAAK
jgi:cell division protein ZipA